MLNLIGATKSVIEKAENRELFKKSMDKIGLILQEVMFQTI